MKTWGGICCADAAVGSKNKNAITVNKAKALITSKLVHYSQQAGEDALVRYANESALNHFQQALDGK